MKEVLYITVILAVFSFGALAAQYQEIYSQPYAVDQNGLPNPYAIVNSTLATAQGMDLRIADNFSGLTDPITKVTVYGGPLLYRRSWLGFWYWSAGQVASEEPFRVRFYDCSGTWTQPPPPLTADTAGTYTVNLYDTYGDGWQGGSLDVLVNGIVVLEGITIADGYGPEAYTFTANVGDEICTVFTAGYFPSENRYEVLDPNSVVIATDGPDPLGIGSDPEYVIGEPDWNNPVKEYLNLQATTTFIANLTWDITWQYYQFDIILPEPVNMAEGWVSAQMSVDDGATALFMWSDCNPAYGDAVAWQYEGAKASKSVNASKLTKSSVRGGTGNDMAFILYTGNDPTLPVELSHFSATMTSENYVQLTWVSQTETNVLGYNVYRSDSCDLSLARHISPLIEGTNTSFAQTYIYLDQELEQDGTYYYWLQSVDMDGTSGFHGPVSVAFSIGNTESPSMPFITRLENAYPNPFNPNTTIRYQLRDAGKVRIDIYNLRGQVLNSFSRTHDAAGNYGVVWDGRDSSGNDLPSGVYLYKMSCGEYSATKRMVLKK